MNFLIIYNPKSGIVKDNIKKEIITYCQVNAINYTFMKTTQEEGPVEIMSRLNHKEFSHLIVSGGDGTISQAVQGLHSYNFKIPLVILPHGTTNEIAQNLGIKDLATSSILDLIVRQPANYINYGLTHEGQTFTYALTFGNFTEVTYKTPQHLKNWLGYRAYILYGLITFKRIHSYNLRIETKEKFLEDDFVFVAVSNSYSLGNIIYFDQEDILLDDGLFEVLLIKKPKNIKELRLILTSFIHQDYENEMFISFKSSELLITCQKSFDLNIDGEFGGRKKEIRISNCQQQLAVIKR